MGDWYPVVKTIKGKQYRYLQQTYRVGGRVFTRNRYLGRVDAGASSTPSESPKKRSQAPSASAPLFQSPSDFGSAMLNQFDAPQWGKDVGEQLLGSAVSGAPTAKRRGLNRRRTARFDFNKPVADDPQAKRRFHSQARARLRYLAADLGLQSGDYDLRSNLAGSMVSGEVTLHGDHLYVSVSQSVIGDTGILYRRCQGRRDYGGHGGNNFAPLDLLNDPDELASRIRRAGILPPAQSPVTTTNENRKDFPSSTVKLHGDTQAYERFRRAQLRYNGASTNEQFQQAKRELDEAIQGLQSAGLTQGQQAYIKNHPNIRTMDGEQFIPKTIEQLALGYKTPAAYIRALKTMQQPEEIAREFYTKYAITTQADIAPALRTIWAEQHGQPVTTTAHKPDNQTPALSSINDAHRRYFTDTDIFIRAPIDAVKVFRDLLETEDAIDQDKEHFYVMHLDIRKKVKLVEIISIGTLGSAPIHPRETFRRAIVEGSHGIIIAHNHPSGEVAPSYADIQTTKALFDAGEIVNIQVCDHIIFSPRKAFSFKENREIDALPSV